jgi:hypothetical protein
LTAIEKGGEETPNRDELVDELFDKRHAVQAIAPDASELVD